MMLRGLNGTFFQLEILRYEFPLLRLLWATEYDSNWLVVRISVRHPRGEWTATEPCLLTYEVAGLADWFEANARGAPVGEAIGFIEPNLTFRLTNDSDGNQVLRIYFELECRPPWAAARAAGPEDLWLDLPLTDLDLTAAARSLRAQLARFPQRTAR
jgi:hypothetical protein